VTGNLEEVLPFNIAMANSELLVPEQASIVKTNINSTLVGLLVWAQRRDYSI
jgi:hypothetical protein